MVMTVSNIRQMSKSSKIDGGAAAASTGSTNASPEEVPIAEEGGGAVPEGLTLGCLEHGLN